MTSAVCLLYSATSPPIYEPAYSAPFVSIELLFIHSNELVRVTKHGVCVCLCVCIIFETSPLQRSNSQSSELWRSIFGIWYVCFGDEHHLKQSFKLNFTEAKLFHLKFLGFYKRRLIFSLAVNRTGFRFHSCWKKKWDWKATRKIALKISEAGQNLRFNFYEFIIIFMEIFTNNDKHFYLFALKKRLLLRDMNPETLSQSCKMNIFGLWTSRRRVWSAGLTKHNR